MQIFSAHAFYEIGQTLANVKTNLQDLIRSPGFSRLTRISDGTRESKTASEQITRIRLHCEAIGLTMSIKAVDRLNALRNNSTATLGETLDCVNHLQTTIFDEMSDKLFMYIPADRATHYHHVESFGKDVNAKFPTIQYDVIEAGNCYATGRSTAVVFHLMRIMEVGVQAFGATLGVKLADEKNWQNILDEVNKAIKALPPKDSKTVMMSQTSANLYAVKLAWRNEVMHPKDTYTLEEADNLIRVVKIFMQQLAEIV